MTLKHYGNTTYIGLTASARLFSCV